jgi:hypothetical protein
MIREQGRITWSSNINRVRGHVSLRSRIGTPWIAAARSVLLSSASRIAHCCRRPAPRLRLTICARRCPRSLTSASGLSATISWGDGSSSAGKIASDPARAAGHHFVVLGSHVYQKKGSRAITVTEATSAASVMDPNG